LPSFSFRQLTRARNAPSEPFTESQMEDLTLRVAVFRVLHVHRIVCSQSLPRTGLLPGGTIDLARRADVWDRPRGLESLETSPASRVQEGFFCPQGPCVCVPMTSLWRWKFLRMGHDFLLQIYSHGIQQLMQFDAPMSRVPCMPNAPSHTMM
jgi:hypothetical protein